MKDRVFDFMLDCVDVDMVQGLKKENTQWCINAYKVYHIEKLGVSYPSDKEIKDRLVEQLVFAGYEEVSLGAVRLTAKGAAYAAVFAEYEKEYGEKVSEGLLRDKDFIKERVRKYLPAPMFSPSPKSPVLDALQEQVKTTLSSLTNLTTLYELILEGLEKEAKTQDLKDYYKWVRLGILDVIADLDIDIMDDSFNSLFDKLSRRDDYIKVYEGLTPHKQRINDVLGGFGFGPKEVDEQDYFFASRESVDKVAYQCPICKSWVHKDAKGCPVCNGKGFSKAKQSKSKFYDAMLDDEASVEDIENYKGPIDKETGKVVDIKEYLKGGKKQ